MSDLADTTPVIIGVGQYAERPDDSDYKALSAMDLGGEALAAAIADCAAPGDVASAIDTIAAIRQFEISVPNAVAPFGKSNNAPRSYGKRVGADPERAILEIVGGQGPQKLVGELATDIAEGRSEVGAIVGSEAISTVLALSKQGERPDWSEEVEGTLEDRGFGRVQGRHFFGAGGFMDAIDAASSLAFQCFSGGNIGGDHEFFDQLVGFQPFPRGDAGDVAVFIQFDLAFRQVQVQWLALFPFFHPRVIGPV